MRKSAAILGSTYFICVAISDKQNKTPKHTHTHTKKQETYISPNNRNI